MQEPDNTTRYFFVDESGDSTFFDRQGNNIVGQPGCSKHLMLGYIRTEAPNQVRRSLREEIANNPYFHGIRGLENTLKAFHAKNDSPEIRMEVYRLLSTLPVKGQFIFARKRLRTFRKTFKSREGAFYDHLVRLLFKRSLHLAKGNHIYFEKRGSRARQEPLTKAVEAASKSFLEQYTDGNQTAVKVECQSPSGEPCLQVVDYFLWAIQRLFLRGEDRFCSVISDQVEFIWDLYDTENYPKNIYTSDNPLDVKKISPL